MAISCSDPRQRSVVCMDECPSRNLICSRSPPLFLQSFAQDLRKSWAPKRSISISFADCSTTDHTAQSPRLWPTLPPFEIDRRSRPSSIRAAVTQALIPYLTQTATATVPQPSSFRLARADAPPLTASSFLRRCLPPACWNKSSAARMLASGYLKTLR